MRLIDADALKHEMEVAPMYAVDMYTACDVIDAAPTVDAVEVVRCKDCHHLLKDNSERKVHLCVRERFARQTSLEDYCSNGERKDGEQNATN